MVKGIIDATSEEFIGDTLIEPHEECFKESNIYGGRDQFTYDYSIDDCVLIRTTDIFPQNHIVLSPKNGYALLKTMPEEFRDFLYSREVDLPYEEKEKIAEKLSIYEVMGRDTIHFCLNGLVGDHAFNSFGGRPYIIVEPLKYHVEDKNLESLRVEDTYFSDRVKLSDEAVLIISEEAYNVIKDDPNYVSDLESYDIYIYKGNNQQKAVSEVLKRLGYDSFLVSSHGYSNGTALYTPAYEMYNYINKYAEDNDISNKPHFGSKFHYEETKRMDEIIGPIVKRMFYIMSRELSKDENELDDYYIYKDKEVIRNLIKEYGIERLCSLVEKINAAILKAVEESKILGDEYKGIKL